VQAIVHGFCRFACSDWLTGVKPAPEPACFSIDFKFRSFQPVVSVPCPLLSFLRQLVIVSSVLFGYTSIAHGSSQNWPSSSDKP
jgi:hypothetical protein